MGGVVSAPGRRARDGGGRRLGAAGEPGGDGRSGPRRVSTTSLTAPPAAVLPSPHIERICRTRAALLVFGSWVPFSVDSLVIFPGILTTMFSRGPSPWVGGPPSPWLAQRLTSIARCAAALRTRLPHTKRGISAPTRPANPASKSRQGPSSAAGAPDVACTRCGRPGDRLPAIPPADGEQLTPSRLRGRSPSSWPFLRRV
jgi:hypothetical protein